MTYATDDADWQEKVVSRANGRCVWLGCNSELNVAGHHVIDRRYSATRLVLENGVCLCGAHHNLLHSAGRQRSHISVILVGARRYAELKALSRESGESDV
jgi:hypothetical protein